MSSLLYKKLRKEASFLEGIKITLFTGLSGKEGIYHIKKGLYLKAFFSNNHFQAARYTGDLNFFRGKIRFSVGVDWQGSLRLKLYFLGAV